MKQTARQVLKKLLGEDFARQAAERVRQQRFAKEIAAIEADPLNPQTHLALAKRHMGKSGNHFIALAQIKTAALLGGDAWAKECATWTSQLEMPNVDLLPHNSYFRYKSLVDEIIKTADGKPASVLDVGGGYGQLACFLPPAYDYCLVEPTTNGLAGENLPFDDKTFDMAVSCHVLEHVPLSEREGFLDSLVSKARKAVILLNPFDIPGTNSAERLELLYSITRSPWVKEHIECTLPTREYIEDYAAKRKFAMDIQNNGTATTTLAMIFLDYFAKQTKRKGDWHKIQRFFNGLDPRLLNSQDDPNALMVTIRVSE